jgi:hypothetical protein
MQEMNNDLKEISQIYSKLIKSPLTIKSYKGGVSALEVISEYIFACILRCIENLIINNMI